MVDQTAVAASPVKEAGHGAQVSSPVGRDTGSLTDRSEEQEAKNSYLEDVLRNTPLIKDTLDSLGMKGGIPDIKDITVSPLGTDFINNKTFYKATFVADSGKEKHIRFTVVERPPLPGAKSDAVKKTWSTFTVPF